MTTTYEGKRATAEWLNENAPIGSIVKSHSSTKYIRQKSGWRDFNLYHTYPLREDSQGYKIIRWGDPWNDLEWVTE